MSDIHVLVGDGLSRWTLIFHFAVPDVNNVAGFNYRTVLLNSGQGGNTSMTEGTEAGQIAAAEKAQIEAGELYEHRVSALIESGATDNTERTTLMQQLYAYTETSEIDRLKAELRYYGLTASKS